MFTNEQQIKIDSLNWNNLFEQYDQLMRISSGVKKYLKYAKALLKLLYIDYTKFLKHLQTKSEYCLCCGSKHWAPKSLFEAIINFDRESSGWLWHCQIRSDLGNPHLEK